MLTPYVFASNMPIICFGYPLVMAKLFHKGVCNLKPFVHPQIKQIIVDTQVFNFMSINFTKISSSLNDKTFLLKVILEGNTT
jgi:hypothetical protein